MAGHNILGKEGENAACDFLEAKGYTIRDRNWRWRKLELDIVAVFHDTLVVIEVKTRRNEDFGAPEEAVNNAKIKRIVHATDIYLKKYGIDLPVRFDVVSVIGNNPPFHIEHFEEAFFPPLW